MDKIINNINKDNFMSNIDEIIKSYDNNIDIINTLRKKVEELEDSNFKDKKLIEMQKKLDDIKEEYRRGFPISKSTQDKISKWQDQHIRKKHWNHKDNCSKSFGAIGGNFSYIFTPTSIGTILEVKCTCGEHLDIYDDM